MSIMKLKFSALWTLNERALLVKERVELWQAVQTFTKLSIFIVMDHGKDPRARIEISENKDGKLLSQLESP